MATMLDKAQECKEAQAIDAIKAAMRLKPIGLVVGELRGTEAAAFLLNQNNKRTG